MSERHDLLVEIGTEELPPKALKRLAAAFAAGVVEGLQQAGLHFADVSHYATPRRLALLINRLDTRQPDKQVERRGPAVTAAFDDDGCPTPAAQGFARSCGVNVEDLETVNEAKGSWLVYRHEQKGEATPALIPAIVQQALDRLPIPKRMRWGASMAEFVRPVHWVVLLLGDEVIEAEILGVPAGRETRGHRFHHPAPLYLGEPAAYAPLLESEGHVIADFDIRREAVRAQVLEAAAGLGGMAVVDDELLDEVTAMVEWPQAVVGDFETRFLEVPPEALITTMKSNQKYFHVVDARSHLLPHFITISNIVSRHPAVVRAGNERVIRPRLSDADFFWNQDRKRPLASHLGSLRDVVFQNKLGTLHDKVQRLISLAPHIAGLMGGDATAAARAAELGKCDLMTQMVGEFPELQGTMGRYYARHDGEAEEVAQSMEEQYLPRFAGDRLPQTVTGQALAIADRLDTLVGIFGIGQPPSGEKDPFALRRAALGVLRIMIENRLSLDLRALLQQAAELYGDVVTEKAVVQQVFDYMMERLRGYYHEQHVSADVFDAVLALAPSQPYDFDRRIQAVVAFRRLAEAESLAAANKRIRNILKQADGTLPERLDSALLQEEAEQALYRDIDACRDEVLDQLEQQAYEPALQQLAGLRGAVDRFFDNVMVMADDPALRNNRLALLNQLQGLFLRVADISRLQ